MYIKTSYCISNEHTSDQMVINAHCNIISLLNKSTHGYVLPTKIKGEVTALMSNSSYNFLYEKMI